MMISFYKQEIMFLNFPCKNILKYLFYFSRMNGWFYHFITKKYFLKNLLIAINFVG